VVKLRLSCVPETALKILHSSVDPTFLSTCVLLGRVLERSTEKGTDLNQAEAAEFLGLSKATWNERIDAIEKYGAVFELKGKKNRSGRLTPRGWEFAMVGLMSQAGIELLFRSITHKGREKFLRHTVEQLAQRVEDFTRSHPIIASDGKGANPIDWKSMRELGLGGENIARRIRQQKSE
jgi:hypothetical protein